MLFKTYSECFLIDTASHGFLYSSGRRCMTNFNKLQVDHCPGRKLISLTGFNCSSYKRITIDSSHWRLQKRKCQVLIESIKHPAEPFNWTAAGHLWLTECSHSFCLHQSGGAFTWKLALYIPWRRRKVYTKARWGPVACFIEMVGNIPHDQLSVITIGWSCTLDSRAWRSCCRAAWVTNTACLSSLQAITYLLIVAGVVQMDAFRVWQVL